MESIQIRKLSASIIGLVALVFISYSAFIGVYASNDSEALIWFGGFGLACLFFCAGIALTKQALLALGAAVIVSLPLLSSLVG